MGCLNWSAALLASLIIPFLFIYKTKNSLVVPSIIYWQDLKEEDLSNISRKLAVLLILQILMMLCLTGSSMRPYYYRRPEQIFLVIDVSASMQAKVKGGIKFELAKKQSLKIVDKLKEKDKMMIIKSSHIPKKLSNLTSDKKKLKNVIKNMKVTDTIGDLEGAVTMAASIMSAGGGEVWVLTDQPPDSVNTMGEIRGTVRFINDFGQAHENVAITSLKVYQGLFDTKRIYLAVKNFSSKPEDIGLEISRGNTILLEEKFRLGIKKKKPFIFTETNNPLIFSNPGTTRIMITADDDLQIDNYAYAVIEEQKYLKVLIVSEDEILIETLSLICQSAYLKFDSIKPDEYNEKIEKAYNLIIFDDFFPEKGCRCNVNSIYIASSPGVLFNIGEDKDLKDVAWDYDHPIMQNASLDIIRAFKLSGRSLPLWSTSIIEARYPLTSELIPLAFYGKINNARVVVFNFNIKEFFKTYLATYSQEEEQVIFTMLLNTIDWLNPYSEGIQPHIFTGERLNVANMDNIFITNPKGRKIQITSESPIYDKTEYIGEYQINNGFSKKFVANLLSETESNITTMSSEGRAQNKKQNIFKAKEKEEFRKIFLWIFLILLIIEWVIYLHPNTTFKLLKK